MKKVIKKLKKRGIKNNLKKELKDFSKKEQKILKKIAFDYFEIGKLGAINFPSLYTLSYKANWKQMNKDANKLKIRITNFKEFEKVKSKKVKEFLLNLIRYGVCFTINKLRTRKPEPTNYISCRDTTNYISCRDRGYHSC